MVEAYILDWLNLVVRWVHIITAVAWVGASFYFNWLLNRLTAPADGNSNVAGELWALHAGGFFLVQKRNLAPGVLPDPLHWFKWEAYWTWISGFALLVLVYYVGADRYLIDPNVSDISSGWAIVLGLAVLAFGWKAYDVAWRSTLANNPNLLTIVCCLVLVAITFGLTQVFSGRGAYMHVGALLGTIMVANVAEVIMPSQRQMVEASLRGEPQDQSLARAAGLRSLHNNYITLPVIFVMVSAHYPSTYGHEWNWLILIGLFAASAFIRHYFNVRAKVGNSSPAWMLVVGAIGIGVVAALSVPSTLSGVDVPTAAQVETIVKTRCAQCHSAKPTQPGFVAPPKGLVLETSAQVRAQGPIIHAQTVATKTMPLGNLTGMTDDERAILGAWLNAGAPDN